MLEGPSLLFLKNKLQRCKGKKVASVSGDSPIDIELFENVNLLDIQTFGKNFLFIFKDFFVAIEVSLMGDVLVNKQKKINASFSFHFEDNKINFYHSEIKIQKGKPVDYFNFKTDITKPEFDAELILTEWQTNHAEKSIGEALLDQNILAGVGPIIRTETLYHAKIHPDSVIKEIPEKKLIFLLKMIQDYAEEFLTLLKTDSVEKNALIFEKKNCPKDKTPIVIEEVSAFKSYICPKCQKLFK